MSNAGYWFVRLGLVAGTGFDLYCLGKAIPLGVAGSSEMKRWFILFFAGVVVNLILGIAYYIKKRPDYTDSEQIQVEALAAMGARLHEDSNEKGPQNNGKLT